MSRLSAFPRSNLVVLMAAVMATPVSAGVLLPTALDVFTTRPQMQGEGLLAVTANPFAPGGPRMGHEYSGWIDVRHPALSGPGSVLLGYDRYDRRVDQATTILKDRNNVTAAADVVTDLDHANAVYARQSGTSVIERSTRVYTSPAVGQAGSFDFPLSHGLGAGQAGLPMEEQAIMQQNVGGGRVDVYYGQSLVSAAFAETYHPSFTAGGNNEALFMANKPVNGPRNTHAHELGHFVTNGQAIHSANAAPDAAHSSDPRNVIGNPQYDPGQNGTAIGNIPNNDDVAGPVVSTSNGLPGGAPKMGGISQFTRAQVFSTGQGLYGSAAVSPFLSKSVNDSAGNRVDWNFLVDDWITEDLGGGADAYPGGRESLYFTPGNPTAPADPAPTPDNGGKDKTGLGVFNNPPAWQGTFKYVDVFSVNARYGDYDVNDQGDSSFRATNLDYDVTFVLPGNVLVAGVATDVYTEGWNIGTFADDYIARWRSPSDAIGVLVTAHRYLDLVTGQFIGNTHIDAVIASNVPEPTAGLMMLLGAMAVRRSRR